MTRAGGGHPHCHRTHGAVQGHSRLTSMMAGVAVAFLVLQMFLSYALRSWSLRAGNIAVIGALITFLAGAMHVTNGRIGWFVLASTVGFACVPVSEDVPDAPARFLRRSIDVFCRSAGDAVAGAADMLTGHAPDRAAKALRRSLDRVMRCRTAVEGELSGALPPAFGQHDIEQLRVALYCAERGIQEVINQADDPRWIDMLPVDIAGFITSALHVLANALRDRSDAQSLDAIACELQSLRDPLYDAATTAASANETPHRPQGRALAVLTTVGAAHLIAQSTSQAASLAAVSPAASIAAVPPSATAAAQTRLYAPSAGRTLAPAVALAIQGAVAAVRGTDRQIAGERAKPPRGVDGARHHHRIGRGVDPASVDMGSPPRSWEPPPVSPSRQASRTTIFGPP